MAQNDPAVLAWLRAEVKRWLGLRGQRCPPTESITSRRASRKPSWMRRRLERQGRAKDLSPSFASATLARDLCVKRGLESAWRPVARAACADRGRGYGRVPRAYSTFGPRQERREVALTGRYRDKPTWSTPYAAARRGATDPRCLEVKRGRDECRKTFRASCSERMGSASRRTTGGIYRLPRQLGPFCRAPRVVDPLFHRRVFKRSRTLGSSWADIHLAWARRRGRSRVRLGWGGLRRLRGAAHRRVRASRRKVAGRAVHPRGESPSCPRIKEDGSATLAISSRAGPTRRRGLSRARLTGGPALRPAVSFRDSALVDGGQRRTAPEPMAPGPPPVVTGGTSRQNVLRYFLSLRA